MNKRLSVWIVVLIVLIIAFAAIGIISRPTLDLESAGEQANLLVARVGGAAKIRKEANQIFRRFAVTNIHFFSASELKDYPAIFALGQVDGIWADSPAYIKVRVGTHINGYIIHIVDTNSASKYVNLSNSVEIGDSCIFVHR